jgi:hypothetical protein
LSRTLKLLLPFFVFVVVGSSPAASALAYVTGGSPWPPSVPCGSSCLGKPVTIDYSYVNMFDGGIKMPDGNPLPNWLIKGSIEEALHVWTTAVNVNFVEVPDGGSVQPQLRFRHVYINGPDPPPPANPIAKAQATCIGHGFGCEVQYDDSDRWQEVGTQPNPDILGATIHEVGHILGLQHTSVVGANMYWIFHRFSGLGTGQLFPDDIAGIRAIYGAGVGSVTSFGVPEPSALALLFLAFGGWLLRRPAR